MSKEKEIWLDPEELQQLLEGGLYWNDIESKFSKENADLLKRRIDKEDTLDVDEIIREASFSSTFADNKNKSSNEPGVDIPESHNEEDVRAILLGENRTPAKNPEIEQDSYNTVIKDRQIDFSHMQEDLQRSFLSQAAASREETMEKTGKEAILIGAEEQEAYEERQMRQELYGLAPLEESEVSRDEKDNFSGLGVQAEYTAARPNNQQAINQKPDQPFKNSTYSDEFEDELEERGSPFGGLKLVILLIAVALITFGFWYYFIS